MQKISIADRTITFIGFSTPISGIYSSVKGELCRASASPPARRSVRPATTLSKKVFVVHGHEEGAREAVARFLEKVELEAIILKEQPDRGFTMIENFRSMRIRSALPLFCLRLMTSVAPYQTPKPRRSNLTRIKPGNDAAACQHFNACRSPTPAAVACAHRGYLALSRPSTSSCQWTGLSLN